MPKAVRCVSKGNPLCVGVGQLIKTYGLTHIGLAVRDAERSLQFYQSVFGVRVVYREAGTIQVQTPGSRDVIVFEENGRPVGQMKG